MIDVEISQRSLSANFNPRKTEAKSILSSLRKVDENLTTLCIEAHFHGEKNIKNRFREEKKTRKKGEKMINFAT